MEVGELENAQLRERARAALGRYFLQAVSVSFIARFFLAAGHVEDAGNAKEYGTTTIDIGSWSWNVYQTSAPEPWLIQINGLMPENLVQDGGDRPGGSRVCGSFDSAFKHFCVRSF